jgi:uncharacterized protein
VAGINKMKHNKKLAAVLDEAKKVFKLDLKRSLHGPGHWEQVERNAIKLAKNIPGCDVNIVRLFAMLHDCKRQDEEIDKGHGQRAARFARELYDNGMLDIDSEQFLTLKFAIKYHNDGAVSNDPTIGVCWDADRLDLPRVGIAPAVDKLSTRFARESLRSRGRCPRKTPS